MSDQKRTIPALFVVNVLVTAALVRRIVVQDEESWEHRSRTGKNTNEPSAKRSWWSGWSNEESLDRIARPLKRDLWSELRHLQLSHKSREPIARSTILVIVMFWLINAL